MPLEKTPVEQCLTDLKETIDTFIKDNKEDHQQIIKRQDYTNGKVKKLIIWRAGLIGAWSVIFFLIVSVLIPLVNEYFKIHK